MSDGEDVAVSLGDAGGVTQSASQHHINCHAGLGVAIGKRDRSVA